MIRFSWKESLKILDNFILDKLIKNYESVQFDIKVPKESSELAKFKINYSLGTSEGGVISQGSALNPLVDIVPSLLLQFNQSSAANETKRIMTGLMVNETVYGISNITSKSKVITILR